MIISASRRTDLPAFYTPWFLNRVRTGHCLVPNPFNRKQVSRVSLSPDNVEAVVFWTRDPRPLMPHLRELADMGHRVLFLYTLLGNPRALDPGCPPAPQAVKTFRELSDRIGPERIIWRYDPIVHTSLTDLSYHRKNFSKLAACLEGYTRRCIFSFVELYRKTTRRLQRLPSQGIQLGEFAEEPLSNLVSHLAAEAALRGMELMHCASGDDAPALGVLRGKCIDGDYLSEHLGLKLLSAKDSGQRPRCGCLPSKDIGMYDTCLFGCLYCYATRSRDRALRNHRAHDPAGPMLIPFGGED